MGALRMANLGLRFLLELAMLAAVALWGWDELGAAAAVALPVAFATIWGMLLSPKARVPAPPAAKLTLELALFALAALALHGAGETALAVTFAALTVANELLLSAWRQRQDMSA